jgi:hypothetical protein
MRRNNLSVLFLIFVNIFMVACFAQPKVYERDSDGKNDFFIYWNNDGSVESTKKISKDNELVFKYSSPEPVQINGEKLVKQSYASDDKDSSFKQTVYLYTKPYNMVFGENYQNDKFFSRTHYKNNIAYMAEFDANFDGKIEERQYFENGKIAKTERIDDSDKEQGYLLLSFYKANGENKGEFVGNVTYDNNAVKLNTNDPVMLELVTTPFVTNNLEKLEPGSLKHLMAIANEAKVKGYIIEHGSDRPQENAGK